MGKPVLPKIDLSLLQLRRALRISRKKTRLKHNHNHKRQRSNKDASDSENQINRTTVHSIIFFSFRALIRELVRARNRDSNRVHFGTKKVPSLYKIYCAKSATFVHQPKRELTTIDFITFLLVHSSLDEED